MGVTFRIGRYESVHFIDEYREFVCSGNAGTIKVLLVIAMCSLFKEVELLTQHQAQK